MSRTKRKVPHPYIEEEGGSKFSRDGKYTRRLRSNKHMKRCTRKLLKLKMLDAWDIPNRDKMGRRV